ncbi:MAG: extracellular solute-binding protein [Spirochaetes bacterium]|nr:extracellular solute-binding protein [Spirochaetota bacterium]
MRRVPTVCRVLLFAAALPCFVTAGVSRTDRDDLPPQAPEEETEDMKPQKTVIDVAVARPFYESCFERFGEAAEAHGIGLSITRLPSDIGLEAAKALIERGNADLFLIPAEWLPGFAESGFLLPLDGLEGIQDAKLGDIFLPMLDFYCKYDGRLYGLPLDGDVRLFYYRKDLLEDSAEKSLFEREYGYALSVPKNVEQAVDFSRFFTRTRGSVLAGEVLSRDFYGIGMALGPGWCHYEWLDRFLSYGGVYFDGALRPLIADACGVRALEDLTRLLRYAPQDAVLWGYKEAKEAFAQGRIASLVLWSDLFKLVYDEEDPIPLGMVGVSHIPGRSVNGGSDFRALMSGGGVMTIASQTEKPDACVWVAASMSADSGGFVFDPRTRCDPFRYSHAACSRELSKMLSDIVGSEISEKDAVEYLDAVEASMEHGVPALTIASSDDYIDLLDLYVYRALTGEIKPAVALKRAAEGWDEISMGEGRELKEKMWESTYAVWEEIHGMFR